MSLLMLRRDQGSSKSSDGLCAFLAAKLVPMRRNKASGKNDGGDDDEEMPDSWQVSFQWIHRQLGRVLELFIVLQFVAGAILFFWGIFLLMWGVVPATSLRSASYMLLAFYFIGRASLGLFGYYTDHMCVIFFYGVLMVATFVTRTIMILVRLKIATSPDSQLTIPPILYVAPGAVQIHAEMICALLEFSQAFCAFYLCFIISKSQEFKNKLKEQNDLNRVLMAANQLVEESLKKMATKIEPKKTTKEVEQEDELSITEVVHNYKSDGNKDDGVGKTKPALPLKGILQKPNNYSPRHADTSQVCPFPSHHHQPDQFQPYAYNRNRLKSFGDYVDSDEAEHDFDHNNNGTRVNFAEIDYVDHEENIEGEEVWRHGQSEEYHCIDYSDPATYMPKSRKLSLPGRDYMDFSPATTSVFDGRHSSQSESMNVVRTMSPTPTPELNLANHSSPLLVNNSRGIGDVDNRHHYGSTPIYVNPQVLEYAQFRRQR